MLESKDYLVFNVQVESTEEPREGPPPTLPTTFVLADPDGLALPEQFKDHEWIEVIGNAVADAYNTLEPGFGYHLWTVTRVHTDETHDTLWAPAE